MSNYYICADFKVDAWEDNIVLNNKGEHTLADVYIGKELMKNVTEKKYLGDIISNDLKNERISKIKLIKRSVV